MVMTMISWVPFYMTLATVTTMVSLALASFLRGTACYQGFGHLVTASLRLKLWRSLWRLCFTISCLPGYTTSIGSLHSWHKSVSKGCVIKLFRICKNSQTNNPMYFHHQLPHKYHCSFNTKTVPFNLVMSTSLKVLFGNKYTKKQNTTFKHIYPVYNRILSNVGPIKH